MCYHSVPLSLPAGLLRFTIELISRPESQQVAPHLIERMRGKKRKAVITVPMREATLKKRLRSHLRSLGFTKSDDGVLMPPGSGKDVIRTIHGVQRDDRLAGKNRRNLRAYRRCGNRLFDFLEARDHVIERDVERHGGVDVADFLPHFGFVFWVERREPRVDDLDVADVDSSGADVCNGMARQEITPRNSFPPLGVMEIAVSATSVRYFSQDFSCGW